MQITKGPEITFLLVCLVALSRIFVQQQPVHSLIPNQQALLKIDGPECLLPVIHIAII